MVYAVVAFFIFAFWGLYFAGVANINWYAIVSLHALPYFIGFCFTIGYLYKKFFLTNRLAFYLLYTTLSALIIHVFQIGPDTKNNYDLEFRNNWPYMSGWQITVDFIISLILFHLFSGVGLGMMLVRTWINNQTEIANLRSEKVSAELAGLKNQLNPHFLFNALNMIHILTKTDPKLASDITLEFSELMRYQISSASNETVALQEEVNFIHNILKIEKQRKRSLELKFEEKVDNYELRILPLILSPLVENAIKHGSQEMEKPVMDIKLEYLNGCLNFTVKNNYTDSPVAENAKSGTGLNNLRKRLELGYGQKAVLHTSKDGQFFKAVLVIKPI